MSKASLQGLAALACIGLSGTALAQSYNFTWANQSLGGGGFCVEIRFDPYHLYRPIGSPPALYLSTDVSGLYRSTDRGNTWAPLGNPSASSEANAPSRYLTTVGFNQPNNRIVAGSTEGIYYLPATGGEWQTADMPERDDPGMPAMNAADGRFPTIGVLREYPRNTNLMLAGLGDLREKPDIKYGLGHLLRSKDGGLTWDLVEIDGAEADEIVYDIDYVPCYGSDSLHVFVTTGHTQVINDSTVNYKGGMYYSRNAFTPAFDHGDEVEFVRITTQQSSDEGQWLKNLISTVILCNNGSPTPVQTSSNIHIYTTRYAHKNNHGGGVYRAVTKVDNLIALSNEPADSQAQSANQPSWILKHGGRRLGRLAAKACCTRTNFELFLGKELEERIYLAVTNHTLAGGTNIFREIVSPDWGNNDPGYRELDGNNTQLKFGSLAIDPEDPWEHPTVFGCWAYGPVKAPGGGSSGHESPEVYPLFDFDSPRAYKQIFTITDGNDAAGDAAYRSRGMDEVFFTGPMPVFKPGDPNVVLIGSGDNGLLRTADINETPVKWSQRKLATSQWYTENGNVLNQFIYHFAFHPLNSNTVLASAGTTNLKPFQQVGQGALLRSPINGGPGAGTGGPENWEIIAGGSGGTYAGLPDAQIHAFVFDVADTSSSSRGLFVGVRNHGIYYARINANGTLDGSFNGGQFVKITDAQLDAVIPTNSTGGHHNYSRLMFDSDSADHLYVSRHWPSGGVFRIKLVSNRTNLAPANCIVQVDEVMKGRFNGATAETGVDTSKTAEVINLLITPTHVFAGVTGGHQADQGNLNYAGGLVRWTKVANPPPPEQLVNNWVIGGSDSLGRAGFNIAIGGLAQDPANLNTILAVTHRFGLRADRLSSSGKYQGEDNYKLMNIWQSTDGGESFTPLPYSVTQHGWPDAVTMAFFPDNPDKIFMPTHGNGVWIGTRSGGGQKIIIQPDSTQTDTGLPRRYALHPNHPNPFNPVTVIRFDLPKATPVTLIIYDVLGRRVRALIDEPMKAGYHARIWDGRNHHGVSVASGVYFYRLHTPEFDKVRKMLIVR